MEIGAVKVIDGMFIGYESISQDLEFLLTNKISHIVHTGPLPQACPWQPLGINYLSGLKPNRSLSRLFPKILRFIDTAREQGNTVFINAPTDLSRCVCVALAYLIWRFKWALSKATEYMHSKIPNLFLPHALEKHLRVFQRKICRHSSHSRSWAFIQTHSEEAVLSNTYLNTLGMQFESTPTLSNGGPRVKWGDQTDFVTRSDVKMPRLKSCLKLSRKTSEDSMVSNKIVFTRHTANSTENDSQSSYSKAQHRKRGKRKVIR